MKNLISMVDFILEQEKIKNSAWIKAEKKDDYSIGIYADSNYIEKTIAYAKLLKQTIKNEIKDNLEEAFFQGQDGRYIDFESYYKAYFGDSDEAGI